MFRKPVEPQEALFDTTLHSPPIRGNPRDPREPPTVVRRQLARAADTGIASRDV